MAQMIVSDSRLDDPRFESRQQHKKNLWVFLSQKCCADSFCWCATQPPIKCIPMHKNDHVCMLKILYSMSEFGGLRKHEQTQHALDSGRIISLLTVTTIWKKTKGVWLDHCIRWQGGSIGRSSDSRSDDPRFEPVSNTRKTWIFPRVQEQIWIPG